MADYSGSNDTMNQRAERASENAVLKLAARYTMAIGVPIALFLGALVANEIWQTTKETAKAGIEQQKATTRIEESLKPLIEAQRANATMWEQQRAAMQEISNRLQAHFDKRFQDVERRNDQQDDKIGKLQEEFWRSPKAHSAPVNSVPPPPSTPSLRVYP